LKAKGILHTYHIVSQFIFFTMIYVPAKTIA